MAVAGARGRAAPAREGVGDVPAVSHLDDDLFAGQPDVQGARARGVIQGVGRQFVDQEHELVGTITVEAAAPCVPGGQRPHGGEVVAVDEARGVGGDRRQRPVAALREQGRAAIGGAGPLGSPAHQGRMRVLGIGERRRVEPGGVVGAQDGRRAAGEGKVDQRLVPRGLPDLLLGARGPDRLSDVAHRPPRVGVEERGHLGDDPGGVAPHLAHVREGDPVGLAVQPVTDHAEPVAGNGDERGLLVRQSGTQEAEHPVQVVVGAGVEHRQVGELRGIVDGLRHWPLPNP